MDYFPWLNYRKWILQEVKIHKSGHLSGDQKLKNRNDEFLQMEEVELRVALWEQPPCRNSADQQL